MMTIGNYVIDYYVLVIVTIGCLLMLKINAEKVAVMQHFTILQDSENQRTYIAAGVSDTEFNGRKILLVMYSLFCRKCNSSDVFVEMESDSESIEVECRKCGHITHLKLNKLFIENKD